MIGSVPSVPPVTLHGVKLVIYANNQKHPQVNYPFLPFIIDSDVFIEPMKGSSDICPSPTKFLLLLGLPVSATEKHVRSLLLIYRSTTVLSVATPTRYGSGWLPRRTPECHSVLLLQNIQRSLMLRVHWTIFGG